MEPCGIPEVVTQQLVFQILYIYNPWIVYDGIEIHHPQKKMMNMVNSFVCVEKQDFISTKLKKK